MFTSKAAQIRFLATEGYSAKEIAAQVTTSPKYVYSVLSRQCSARTTYGRLDQLSHDLGMLRAEMAVFRQELGERLGIPGIIERRLKAIL